MRKNKSLKMIAALLGISVLLSGCGSSWYQRTTNEQTVQSKLNTAAILSDEELYERAKKEIASGSVLDFYSVTSTAEVTAENFMKKYPKLKGKLIYHGIDDAQTYELLSKEIRENSDTVDMMLTQNGADLEAQLIQSGLAYQYFPEQYLEQIGKEYQLPAVVCMLNTLFIYNNSDGELETANIWQFTEDEWKGKIYFKDPLEETENMNFLVMLTSPKWTEKIAAAYEEYYGVAWEDNANGTDSIDRTNNTNNTNSINRVVNQSISDHSDQSVSYQSASYEWIDRFLKNCDFDHGTNSQICTDVANADTKEMGFFVFNKVRKLEEEQKNRLTVMAYESETDCFSGYLYAIYATVAKNTDCPYTCALFINYLLSEEGFSGDGSWNDYSGYYSANTAVHKTEEIDDRDFGFWEENLVVEDSDYIEDNIENVREFVEKSLK